MPAQMALGAPGGGGSCLASSQPQPTSSGSLQAGAGCEECCETPSPTASASGVHDPCEQDQTGGLGCSVEVITINMEPVVSSDSPLQVSFTIDLSSLPARSKIVSVEVHYEVVGGGPLTLTDSGGGGGSLPSGSGPTPAGITSYWNANGVRGIGAAVGDPAFPAQAEMSFSVPPPGSLEATVVFVGYCGPGAYWPGG